jgi:serpin B
MLKTKKITVLILTAVLFTSSIYAANTDTVKQDSGAIAGGISEFAFNLYGQMIELPELKQSGGNLFFSPYSISTALAMTYCGARGDTASQMASVLRLPTVKSETIPLERIAAGYGTLQKSLQADPDTSGYQLNVANALWCQKDYSLWDSYTNLFTSSFGAGFNKLDFVGQTEASRKTINTWIKEQTNKKIKDLIPAGNIDATTRLVLTNAIYFKGDWATQFKKDDTESADFNVTPDKKVQVQMMYQKGTFDYGESDMIQVLQMPYKGDELAMMIVLPKPDFTFDEFEKKFVENHFLTIASASRKKIEVEVFLPKFKITCGTLELKGILREMGMKDAFSDAADFSGMTGKRDLYISNVMHKAFVEVNEEGTEAAAATAVGMKLTSLPMSPPVFRADRSFIFFILDTRTNCILFVGRVMNPTLQG